MATKISYNQWLIAVASMVTLFPCAAFADSIAMPAFSLSASDFVTLSPLAQLFAVFLGGIASSLTPCVYPLIPITLAVLGATKSTSRVEAFLLSCAYVLGIVLTYTTLGLTSALTGSLFGSYLGNPLVIFGGVLLLCLLGLCALDIIPFRLSYAIQERANRIGGNGPLGAFFMGAVSGVIAAPCVGPILAVILGVAAASQQALWGGALLFAYSLGLGCLFILLGTFSSLLQRIPRGGSWLLTVKFLLAVAIFMVAAFLSSSVRGAFGASLAPLDRTMVLLIMSAISLGFALIAYRIDLAPLKALAAALLGFCLFEVCDAPAPLVQAADRGVAVDSENLWLTSYDKSLSVARERGTIAMVDLFGSWCASCKELDQVTFQDRGVKEMLQKITVARVDFTGDSDENIKLQEKYNVAGLPCILFLRPDGTEIEESRITGFTPPEKFVSHIEHLLSEHAIAKSSDDARAVYAKR